jgi:hypothetical protein
MAAAVLAAATALIGSRPLAAGAAADPPPLRFTLPDVHGAAHTARDWAGARAVVLFFVMPDCPISQGYVPEMNRIADAYTPRGVRFHAVQSDAGASAAAIRQHVEEFGYRFPVLLDRGHLLVRHAGATITPEAAVIAPSGRVLYRGRIDDRIVSFGTRRPRATRHDLREALDDVLAGRAVARPRTDVVGCFITPLPRGSGTPHAAGEGKG